jgi:MacB-like periplasmic core domain
MPMLSTLRVTSRRLAASPVFSIAALLTLALCIGANLTIFAVIDAVLLRPLPFPGSDRLVTTFNIFPKMADSPGSSSSGSLPNYYERRGNISAFSSLSTFKYESANVGEGGMASYENVLTVSAEFFTTLGVAPHVGRPFTEAEMTRHTDNEVIVSDAYWRKQFLSCRSE